MKSRVLILSALFVALLQLPITPPAQAAASLREPESSPRASVIRPDSFLTRLVYSILSANWWQWALSQPPARFPIIDPTGENQQYGQSGPVWFLAGNFGGVDVRNVTIPHGKFIFFPVINSEWDTVPGFPNPLNLPDPLSISDIRAITDYFIDGNTSACTIDGRAVNTIQRFRVQSPVFSFDFHPDLAPFLGYPVTHVETAVTDGVWIMLAPPSRGRHTIRFTTSSPLGFSLDITYNIIVD